MSNYNIEIIIAGRHLDVSPNTKITVEENSNFMQFDEIPGSYTYPFNIPMTPLNRLILGFPDMIEVNDEIRKNYECTIKSNDIVLVGKLYVIEYLDNTLKCTFNNADSFFSSKLGETRLQDLDYGDDMNVYGADPYDGPADLREKKGPNNPDNMVKDYCFVPFYNPGVIDPSNTTVLAVNDPFMCNLDKLSNSLTEDFDGSMSGDYVFEDTLKPFLYNTFVMDLLFNFIGYKHYGFLATDPDCLQKLIYSNCYINKKANFAADANTNELAASINAAATSFNLKYFVPEITLKEYLRTQKKMYCLYFDIDNVSQTFTTLTFAEIMGSNDFVDYTAESSEVFGIKDSGYQGLLFGYELDPNDKALITNFDYTYGNPMLERANNDDFNGYQGTTPVSNIGKIYRVNFNTSFWKIYANPDPPPDDPIFIFKFKNLSKFNPKLAAYTVTGTFDGLFDFRILPAGDYPLGVIYHVKSTNQFIKGNEYLALTSAVSVDGTNIGRYWRRAFDPFTAVIFDIAIDDAKTEIKIPCPVLNEILRFNKTDIQVPVAVDLEFTDNNSQRSPLRFFYTRGVSQYINVYEEFDYDYASHANYNPKGERVGETCLTWYGDDGLYTKYWADAAAFLKRTKIITRGLRVNTVQLRQFDFKRKIKIGNAMFLPKKRTYELPFQDYDVVKMEYYLL